MERDQILDSHLETAQEDVVKHKLMLKPSLMRNQVHAISLNLCQFLFMNKMLTMGLYDPNLGNGTKKSEMSTK